MSSRTSMWSIWLCGRCAGYVRPRTARRQPGQDRDDRRAPEVEVARDDRGPIRWRQLRPQRAEVPHRRRAYQSFDDVCTPTTSTVGAADVERARERRARGPRGSRNDAPIGSSRRRAIGSREQTASSHVPVARHRVAVAVAAARLIASVHELRSSRRGSPSSRERVEHAAPVVGAPRLRHHDDVGVEAAHDARDVEPHAAGARRTGRRPSAR